jgi:tetratricopeptide (TPR) repeat protein
MHFLTAFLLIFAVCTGQFISESPALGAESFGSFKVYRGLFHAHNSEGGDDAKRRTATIEYAYNFAKGPGGLDFFGLSPHSHMINDDFFARLKGESKDYSTQKFAAIYGGEWGVMSMTGHFGTLFTDNMLTIQLDPKISPYNHLENYFSWLETQKNAVVVLNHPEVFDFGYYYNPVVDERINLVEVFSGSAFETRIDQIMGSKSYADQLMILLNRGWHVGVCGNQDNHFPTYGLATETRTGILAPTLKSAEIRKALAARRSFASQDKNLSAVLTADVNGTTHFMGEQLYEINEPVTLKVTVSDPDGEEVKSITIFSDSVDCGELGSKIGGNTNSSDFSMEITPEMADRFYIAEIRQTDGHVAWTSPIWISSFSEFQCDMVKLLIAKKQYQGVKNHLAHLKKALSGRADPYITNLTQAARYLKNIDQTMSEKVYPVLTSARGEKLRQLVSQCGSFLTSIPVWDAIILVKDLKELAASLALTSEEGVFIKDFIRKTNDKFKDFKLDASSMEKMAEKYMKAKNYNLAALIFHNLQVQFPDQADAYGQKLMVLYQSLEAFQAAISLSDNILSIPGLDQETAFEVYLARGMTYMRQASKIRSVPKTIQALELARNQFLQLLSDFPNLDSETLAKTEEILGDCMARLMSKDKANKEEHYKSAADYYNHSLSRTTDITRIFFLNAKISGLTLKLESTPEMILQVIEDMKSLMSEYPDSRESDMMLKNLGDLYAKLSKKIKDPAEKKKYFQQAVLNYRDYTKKTQPKVMDTLNFEIGSILMSMKQYSGAIKCFAKIEKENLASRKLEWSLFNIAQCYLSQGKHAEAIKIAERLMREFPNFDLCWQNNSKKEVDDLNDSVVGTLLQRCRAVQDLDLDVPAPVELVDESLFYDAALFEYDDE